MYTARRAARQLQSSSFMKKLALVLVLGVSAMACRAQVRVHATAAPAQAPIAEPAPAPVVVEQPKVGELLTLPEQVEFETNEARIKQTPKTIATLEQLAETMKKHPNITKLRVEGHTDNVGKDKRNDKLSKARAEAVANWLSLHDVAASRIVTAGFGAKRPLVPNDSADHRAMNRRTEYYVEELDGKKVDDSQKVASGGSVGGRTTN
jgi:outer membrane protein OmpA-like peptidoglycan-associated protein